jgi:hypothetical protein
LTKLVLVSVLSRLWDPPGFSHRADRRHGRPIRAVLEAHRIEFLDPTGLREFERPRAEHGNIGP